MMNKLEGKRIGFGFTGSHHSHKEVFPQLEKLFAAKAEVIPIISNTVKQTDTTFGRASEHIQKIEEMTNRRVISTIPEAEPFGPKEPLDCMVIAPLTGNSLSKLANALTDNAVLMAAKATLRNEKPVVLGVTTNDALGLNGVNLIKLLNTKNVYFIPFGQDQPFKKSNSLVAKWDSLPSTVRYSLDYKQIQPLLVPHQS